jgi:hypothetical protein
MIDPLFITRVKVSADHALIGVTRGAYYHAFEKEEQKWIWDAPSIEEMAARIEYIANVIFLWDEIE